MSLIPPGLSRLLQFYLSGPLPCPYLPDQVERKLFTRLSGDHCTNEEINAILTRAGFRRSHDIVYRPACPTCTACVPARIPVRAFVPSRNLRKITAHNRDLICSETAPLLTDEIYQLFITYQQARHSDSEMARMTPSDLAAMLEEGQAGTQLYTLRDQAGILRGAILTDHVHDGISAVYSFYDPQQPKRSLGIQLILSLINLAQQNNWSYVYLGYWIEASNKMAYKSRFQPLQKLGANGWV